MNFHSFLLLDSPGQSDVLYKEAVYVGKRTIGSSVAVLYQLNFFYVEIIYTRYRYQIKEIQCFIDTEILNYYPEHICIEEFV